MAPLGGCILDFVCFEARLIMEVDGGQHSEAERDLERHFEGHGLRTVGFWNDQVVDNMDAVCGGYSTSNTCVKDVATLFVLEQIGYILRRGGRI